MKNDAGTESAADKFTVDNLISAYRLYNEMMRYPHLVRQMRTLFLSALCERGIVCEDALWGETRERAAQSGPDPSAEQLAEIYDLLTDLYFARHFTWEEIENHIHLARKWDAFEALTRIVNAEGASWQKVKHALKELCDIPQGSLYISPEAAEGVRVTLIGRFISDQLPFIGVAKKHITIRDVDEILDHTFLNPRRGGKIGGKAGGMVLAEKILLPRLQERDAQFEQYVRIPESHYFNSGFLSDFTDYNRLYSFHSQKYKNRETLEQEFSKIAEVVQNAAFPPDVMKEFRRFLEKIGEHPLIIRSSSLLEDSFGYTFSGKYDSVFIANHGTIETRLNEFTLALKQVVTSIYSPKAILYRRDHNLLDFDERMSFLVQKVVGRRFGRYFFPLAAGVAFSRNLYTWTPRIDKSDGLLRLVLGLGTRAVDRTGPDYPRLVPLSHPGLRPEIGAEQIRKYSQKLVDVLDLEARKIQTVPAADLFREIDYPDLFYAASAEREGHLSPPLFKNQEIDLATMCVTLDNLLSRTPLAELMKRILKRLSEEYGRGVEVEFAWDADKLYILQCRTLAIGDADEKIDMPEAVPQDQVLFTCSLCLFSRVIRDIEYVVYIDPRTYAQMATFEERLTVGRIVNRINRALEHKRFALFGPSRWGTNEINLGVRVAYDDINKTKMLAEIAMEELGTAPEPSFGTHFFNDLVEARIAPLAIYAGQPNTVFREDFFVGSPNMLASLLPEFESFAGVARVIHVPSCTGGRLLHVYLDSEKQEGIGFFAREGEME